MSQPARNRTRKYVRLDDETLERVGYWCAKHQMSEQEYLEEAVREQIRRENLDYDIPTLEIARLNELIDRIVALESTNNNLTQIVIAMTDTFTALTRGDGPNGPLGDAEDGELYG